MLVYAKMYKSAAEVPEVITSSQIKKARDLFRIRVSIGMCIATFFGCIVMVYSGKKAMVSLSKYRIFFILIIQII